MFYLLLDGLIIGDGQSGDVIIVEVYAEDVCVSAALKKQSLLLFLVDRGKQENLHTSIFLLF